MVLFDFAAMSILSHKIRLKPNRAQIALFRQLAGARRWTYNWALETWQFRYAAGEKVNDNSLRRDLTQLKKTDEYKWLATIPQAVTANAVRDLGVAFKNFFRAIKAGTKPGFPNFKKRGFNDGFCPVDRPESVKVSGKSVYIRGVGWVRMRESLRFIGRPTNVTISLNSDGHWYAAISVELDDAPIKTRLGSDPVGIDLGCSTLAVLSNGEVIKGEKHLDLSLSKLIKLQQKLSKQVKGSNRRTRTKSKIARLHARIRNQRSDALHKFTTATVLRFGSIAIEDLAVKGMVKLRSLARSLANRSFAEVRRQLTYKAELYGSTLHVVSRWFPSSKTCSGCGNAKSKLGLDERIYYCDNCGLEIDRDLNAAINLERKIPGLDRKLTHVESSLAGA